jgi:hypothetical protein
VNPWAAIEFAVIQIDLLNFGGQSGIFSTVLRGFTIFPAIIATL